MTDPGFKVEGIHQAVPFRPRTAFAGYHQFGDRDSAVLIEPAAARGLRTAASTARPRETGGLLSGRTLRDGSGPYVLVSGFVEAGPGSGRAAAFDVSPGATAQLREESSRANPTADVVGWWHSHIHPSSYSHTDLASQSVWTQPHSVGLLVFAAGEPWATAYMGPDAKDLGYPALAIPPGAACPPGPTRPERDNRAGAAGRPGPPAALTIADPPWQPNSGPTPRQQGLIRLAMITLSLILATILLAALHGLSLQLSSEQRKLSGQIQSGQSQVDDQLHRALASRDAPPSIAWSCLPGTPSAAFNLYSCAAKASGPPGEVRWRLDGKPSGTGPRVTIRVPKDGRTHQLLALLKTSTGTYPGVPQTIFP